MKFRTPLFTDHSKVPENLDFKVNLNVNGEIVSEDLSPSITIPHITGKPIKPVDPIKPIDPVNPVKPLEPIGPAKPVNPTKPIKLVDVIKSENQKQSIKSKKEKNNLPKTGESKNEKIFKASTIGIILTSFVLFYNKRLEKGKF